MNLLFKVAFVVGMLSLALSSQSCTSQDYRAAKLRNNQPVPTNQQEFNARKQRYCLKKRQSQEIAAQNLGYTLECDKFWDLSPQETNNLLGAKRPPPSNVVKAASSLEAKKVANTSLTAQPIDWRKTNDVSSIKDQGRCGSCWSFTSIGMYQSYLMVKGKREYDLSEQFLLECTDTLIDNGLISSCKSGYVDNALKVVVKYGAPLESKYPYLGTNYTQKEGVPSLNQSGICDTSQDLIFYDQLPGVVNSTNMTRRDNITVDEIHNLLQQGPVGAMIYADAGLMSYKSGVYSGCPQDFNVSYEKINHAVVIVGYDNDGNYIIKNSWGTNWGEQGFGTVSKDNDCALSAFVYQLTWGFQLVGSALITLVLLLFVI